MKPMRRNTSVIYIKAVKHVTSAIYTY